VPLARLPSLAHAYRAAFFPAYPVKVSSEQQLNLDKGFGLQLARQTQAADCDHESCVALTFDDGPVPVGTSRVLDILRAAGVQATFFVQGNRVQTAPALVKRAAAEGHEIENHTFAHPDLVKLHNPALIRKQIDETQAALAGVGVQAKFLRPPYGSVDAMVRQTANMPLILWNVDAQEWRPAMTPETMAASVISQTRPGAIILMHDPKPITAAALPLVIEGLRQRSFRFVTVEQLLRIDGSARGDFASR
jgi:peptidoglycan/xylan/chitin deacetylase (PgdA/CDA1 family)